MKKLFILEDQTYLGFLKEKINLSDFDFYFLHSSKKRFQFKYPSNLTFDKYPYFQDPIFKYNSLLEDSSEIKLIINRISLEYGEIHNILPSYEEIILVLPTHCDRFMYAFENLLNFNLNCSMDDYSNRFLRKLTVINPRETDDSLPLYDGRVCADKMNLVNQVTLRIRLKDSFDYNFNINSVMLFNSLGYGVRGPIINKDMLFIMFILNKIIKENIHPVTSIGLMRFLADYKGTGRFKDTSSVMADGYGFFSVEKALINLEGLGLVEINRNFKSGSILSITEFGESFLVNRVHPKSFDPDMPFRLNEWSCVTDENGYYSSSKKIENYLKVYFKRQKRFFNKSGHSLSFFNIFK